MDFSTPLSERKLKSLRERWKQNTKHGHCQWNKGKGIMTAEYRAWVDMKSRCYNKNVWSYKYYGGRGIKVCLRWLESFKNFLNDMGCKPYKNYSIDRINNDSDYSPLNCRWATKKEQADNRSWKKVK